MTRFKGGQGTCSFNCCDEEDISPGLHSALWEDREEILVLLCVTTFQVLEECYHVSPQSSHLQTNHAQFFQSLPIGLCFPGVPNCFGSVGAFGILIVLWEFSQNGCHGEGCLPIHKMSAMLVMARQNNNSHFPEGN